MIPILAVFAAAVAAVIAQAAADPSVLIPLAAELLEAIVHGQWWKVAAAVVSILTWCLRGIPWRPLASIPGQVIGAFLLASLGGVFNALIAGAWSVEVLVTAIQIGAAAGAANGGLTALWAWWRARGSGPGGAAATAVLLCLALPGVAGADVSNVGSGGTVSCGTTATKANDPDIGEDTNRMVTICLADDAARSIKVGGKNLTLAKGVTVRPGKCFSLGVALAAGTSLYCIASQATDAEVIAVR